MVSAYFKNIGQTRTLIQLIQDRSAIQQLSGEQMKEKELREAESRAKPQTFITEAELSINTQSNQGEAEY